jgi:hypothetical protein
MLKTKTVKQVSVQDWDEFVSSTYGKPYVFQQQDGCKERGTEEITVPEVYVDCDYEETEIPFEVNGREMGVSFETWLNTAPEETAKHFGSDWENNLFWERNFYPEVRMIANDLHSRGLLEPGEYSIVIDW